jgi:anti-sigma-K factor RskA
MSNQRRIDSEDLALYAMQLLGPEETAAVELLLKQDPAARQEVAEIRGDLAAYAYSAETHTPPALARTRLMKQIAREKKQVPLLRPIPVPLQLGVPQRQGYPAAGGYVAQAAHLQEQEDGVTASIGAYQRGGGNAVPSAAAPMFSYETEASKPGLVSRVMPWVGWAVAASLAVSTVQFYRERQQLRSTVAADKEQMDQSAAQAASARDVLNAMNDSAAMRVTLRKPFAPVTPTGRTTYSAEKGVLVFVANNLDPVDTFKVYELWMIPADEKAAPVPVGTFRPDANGFASLIRPDMPKGAEAKAFGITVENDGGAKTPTLPILMAGA